jgi:hypothetical protein
MDESHFFFQKALDFFSTTAFEKKGWTITHEKYHFLLDMHFLEKDITNLTSNFT